MFTKFQSDRGYFSLDLRPLRVKLFYFDVQKANPRLSLYLHILALMTARLSL